MKLKFFAAAFTICMSASVSYAQEEITLEQVVALALEKNYDVRLAKNYVEVVDTDNDYANAAFLPTLNGTASKVWNKNDQRQRLRRQDAADTLIVRDDIKSDNISASLQLSWTLFDGTRMFATRKRVSEIDAQGEALLRDQMVNTVAMIITSYYDVVRQKQQLQAIQEQMAVSEERVKLAERKLQVGAGIKPELLQAQVDLNAQRAQVLQQQTVIAQLKDQLNGLTGMQLQAPFDVADTIIVDYAIQKEVILSSAENNNFSLKAARQDVQIAELLVHERRAEYLPRLNFNSAYNFSRTENAVAINNFTPLFNQNRGLNYGFSVTVPIFNGLNQRRLVQQSRINVFRQQILYDQLKTDIDIGISNAYVAYENSKKILTIEEETIGLAKENVFIAFESFKRGVTTFIELRTAQQSLESAYNRLIAARYNAKVAETELLRLSGGLLR
jgi:outer membrane protein